VDATGVGAGLASFLDKAFLGKVIPYVFNVSTKSKLGWGFLAVIDSGRYKEYLYTLPPKGISGEGREGVLQALFFSQLSFCQFEIQNGPDKKMKWGVPDGARNPASGDLVHDDLVLSAALVAALDEQDWSVTGPALVVPGIDPLLEMDKGF
jgi:hypothetical protein